MKDYTAAEAIARAWHPHVNSMATFWNHVDKTPGCWNWTGTITTNGYGQFSIRRVRRPAHRWSFEDANGPVPAGLELDHLCRNRRCVRPDHLEAVPHRVNSLRGASAQRSRTECPRGHAYDAANTYVGRHSPGGGIWRRCRACHREAERRRRITP